MNNIVAVEIGNTNYKIYYQNTITLTPNLNSLNFEKSKIYYICENPSREKAFLDYISKNSNKVIKITKQDIVQFLPFINLKKYPTIGIDRLINMAYLILNENYSDFLLIDMGTAITYNLVKSKQFAGGAISPNFSLRFLSLQNLNLPKAELDIKPINLFYNNTLDAIKSGIYNGIIGELSYFITNSNMKNIIFTGNGCKFIIDFIHIKGYKYYKNLIIDALLFFIKKMENQ